MQKIHNLVKPQNGRNHVSEDIKFQKFPGENVPGPPTWGLPLAAPLHQTPL